MVGPFRPLTGVTLANTVVREELLKSTLYNLSIIDTSYGDHFENIGTVNFSKAFFFIKLQFKAVKVLNCDLVYITPGQTFAGIMKYAAYIFLASLSRKRIILHLHGNYLATQYKKLFGIKKWLFKKMLQQTDKGIVLSESLKKNFTPFIPERQIFTLKNFVQNELFEDPKIVRDQQLIQISYLSNLIDSKGIFDLMETLLILSKKQIIFKARIAGNVTSANRERLETYLTQLPEVNFLGRVDLEEKKKLLQWSNIFVLPTYYPMEGQPIAILEAMATGNIIITTRHAGIPDIFIEGSNGFYVKKRNPKDIAIVIERIIRNPELLAQISLNNRKETRKKYTVEKFINGLKNILDA